MFYAKGTCLGVKTEVITPRDKTKPPFEQMQIGMTAQKVGGFPGETETLVMNLSKELVEHGAVKHFTDQKGKVISVPFFVRNRAYNNNVYSTYYVSNDALAS